MIPQLACDSRSQASGVSWSARSVQSAWEGRGEGRGGNPWGNHERAGSIIGAVGLTTAALNNGNDETLFKVGRRVGDLNPNPYTG